MSLGNRLLDMGGRNCPQLNRIRLTRAELSIGTSPYQKKNAASDSFGNAELDHRKCWRDQRTHSRRMSLVILAQRRRVPSGQVAPSVERAEMQLVASILIISAQPRAPTPQPPIVRDGDRRRIGFEDGGRQAASAPVGDAPRCNGLSGLLVIDHRKTPDVALSAATDPPGSSTDSCPSGGQPTRRGRRAGSGAFCRRPHATMPLAQPTAGPARPAF